MMNNQSYNSNNRIRTAHEIVNNLRTRFLPDLQALRLECIWLKTNLGLEGKRELQSNETKLLQFVQMIDQVIAQIETCVGRDVSRDPPDHYLKLETTIIRTILPVRARLHEKWRENQGTGNRSVPTGVPMAPPPNPTAPRPSGGSGLTKRLNGNAFNSDTMKLAGPTVGFSMGSVVNNNIDSKSPRAQNNTSKAKAGNNKARKANAADSQKNGKQGLNLQSIPNINTMVPPAEKTDNTTPTGYLSWGGASAMQHRQQPEHGYVSNIPRNISNDSSASNSGPWKKLTGSMLTMQLGTGATAAAIALNNNKNTNYKLPSGPITANVTKQSSQSKNQSEKNRLNSQNIQEFRDGTDGGMGVNPFGQSNNSNYEDNNNTRNKNNKNRNSSTKKETNIKKESQKSTRNKTIPDHNNIEFTSFDNNQLDLMDSSGFFDNGLLLYDDFDTSEQPLDTSIQNIDVNPGKRSYNSTINNGDGSNNDTISLTSTANSKSNRKSKSDSSLIYYSSAVDIDINSQSNPQLGLSFPEGNQVKEDEYMSSRRRRRLNQIVPNPRKPRTADYTCFLCSEPYSMTVVENPWWAVFQHECPKCKAIQIPRIDISTTRNAIELDPNVTALYGEGLEDSDDEDESGVVFSDDEDEVNTITNNDNNNSKVKEEPLLGDEKISNLDNIKEEKIDTNNPSSSNKDTSNTVKVPFDGDGLLASEEASKLLVLMCHARSCSGIHASEKHAEVCKSTKYLMLHIRDCKGTDIQGRDCMFPWCRPCKKMLRHLTQCFEPDTCTVCNPWCLPSSFKQLQRLNQLNFCQPVNTSDLSNNDNNNSNSVEANHPSSTDPNKSDTSNNNNNNNSTDMNDS